MSALTRNRLLLFACACVAAAQSLLAATPSGRSDARMVFETTTGNAILFGGEASLDKGTGRTFELNETWLFNGLRWVQAYPKVSPSGRSAQVMVWDSNRNRTVLFGGHDEAKDLNDTWVYQNNNWTQLETPSAPTPRRFAGYAFDPLRDRLVVFGGLVLNSTANKLDSLFDTWEFDGTTWRQVGSDGPHVDKPLLVWDGARNKLLMLGMNEKQETQMYSWNGSTWESIKPAAVPPCINQSALFYNPDTTNVVLVGGVCLSTASSDEETWLWDGNNWSKFDAKLKVPRSYGQAATYDARRNFAVLFGGTLAFTTSVRRDTYVSASNEWIAFGDVTSPGSRSLAAFRSDPARKALWVIGGLSDDDFYTDVWTFQNNQWLLVPKTETSPVCSSPLAAVDTDRNKLVVVCSAASATYEFDGTEWKQFKDLKTIPKTRRFGSMVYDPSIRKTVLFGGFDEANYMNDTWTWDGTQWTEVKKKRPTARALTSLWYDPVSKKTLLYGGIGRPDPEDRITRYSDMWSFDGTGWTDMKVTATPGQRYGAQVAVDPTTSQTYLFGGLLFQHIDDKTPDRQLYVNDFWQWNGSSWKKLELPDLPPARENAVFEWDPSQNQLVLFSGWAGYFLSDMWTFKDGQWQLRKESIVRRRAAGH